MHGMNLPLVQRLAVTAVRGCLAVAAAQRREALGPAEEVAFFRSNAQVVNAEEIKEEAPKKDQRVYYLP